MKKVLLDVKGENKGHYAPGVISNGMMYISGQLFGCLVETEAIAEVNKS